MIVAPSAQTPGRAPLTVWASDVFCFRGCGRAGTVGGVKRGKAMTTVSGVPIDDAGLMELAGKLKRRSNVRGSVKGGVIEIQGDHRDAVVEIPEGEGYTPVLGGG
jgi:hypothetical protein